MTATPEQLANRKRWCEALRSGKYEQGRLRLRRSTTSAYKPGAHCCLGVAAAVLNIRAMHQSGKPAMWLDYEHAREVLGITSQDQGTLSSMNDHYRNTFEEIAKAIEALP